MQKTVEQIHAQKETVKSADTAFVLWVCASVLLITLIPYLFAYLSAPPDKQFMGIMLDTPDHLQYFSWMREFSTANLSANKLTPEANAPIFFNLLWWMLAKTDNIFHFGFVGALHLIRIIATPLFLLVCNRILAWYFSDRFQRRIALLAITFMAGLGWILVLLKYTLTKGVLLFPLDVFIAEGNTFLDILGYPHFIAAALYIFVFVLVIRGLETGQIRYAVGAGLFALFLGWQHTYDLISVYFALLAFALLMTLRDRKIPIYLIKAGVIIGFISIWPALYSVMLTNLDPLWKEVLAQFDNANVFTPGLLHLPILFGLPFILAIFTVVRGKIWKQPDISDADVFLYGWFFVTFLTIYIPVDYQIHLLNGWQVPMAILAVRGFYRFINPWIQQKILNFRPGISSRKIEWVTSILLVAVFSITNVYHFGQRIVELKRHTYPYYLYKDEVAAMQWLDANAAGEDVILSSLEVGQYLPAYTGSHAFLAHWAQTVDYYTKEEMVKSFFAPTSLDVDRRAILDEFSVDYVFYGPAENAIGSFDPNSWPELSPVFSSNLVTVYKVEP